MKLSPATLMIATFGLGFIACSTAPKKPEAAKKTAPVEGPKLVGRIASIPADKRFVLIQSYGKWEMAAGAILTTRGPDERLANLRVTGETLGEFAAADVQSGTFEKGDAVYSQPIPPPPTPSPLPEPPKPEGRTENTSTPKTLKF